MHRCTVCGKAAAAIVIVDTLVNPDTLCNDCTGWLAKTLRWFAQMYYLLATAVDHDTVH